MSNNNKRIEAIKKYVANDARIDYGLALLLFKGVSTAAIPRKKFTDMEVEFARSQRVATSRKGKSSGKGSGRKGKKTADEKRLAEARKKVKELEKKVCNNNKSNGTLTIGKTKYKLVKIK